MLFGQRGDGLHRHDQTGAVSDVSQGHQLDLRMTDEGFAVSLHQAVVARRVRVSNLDHFSAALPGEPAHGAFDRVVFQIADQHLIARLQAVVVANQRLQAFGGIAGERHTLRAHANQLGQLRANIEVVVLLETLAHVHRVAGVDQLDVALVFLDHRARHAPEITVFQVHGAGLNVVTIGERSPKGFVTGAAGVIGHGRLTQERGGRFNGAEQVCRVWRAAVRAGPRGRYGRSPASVRASHRVRRAGNLRGQTSSGMAPAGQQ
ncbi:hypothetical protein D3C81_1099660 [compost metagenome]